MLRYLTDCIEALEKEGPERDARLRELQDRLDDAPTLAGLFAPKAGREAVELLREVRAVSKSEMPTKTAEPTTRKARRRWRKPVLIAAGMVLLVAGTALGIYFYLAEAAESQMREALAETDRLDPGWRLDELEARRAVIPDAENSARCIERVKKLMPKDWGSDSWFGDNLDDLPPEPQLNVRQIDLLRTELAKAAAALQEARKLKDLPRGRFAVNHTRDWVSTLRPYLEHVRAVAYLLDRQALLQNQERASDAAIETCRCIVNCGRSTGDDPCLITALVRYAVRSIACESIERTLAQGQPSPAALQSLQQLLEQEEPEPLLLIGIRGERAGLDRLLQAILDRELDAKKLAELQRMVAPNTKGSDRTPLESVLLASPLGLKHQRAALLRYMNQCVEIARKPCYELTKRFQELDTNLHKQQPIVQAVVTPFSGLAGGEQRSRALLRSAIAAIAAERYRRERGAWPKAPSDLVKGKYLQAWPKDPFDGAPLRWKRLEDGLVIYALGNDGVDDGGKLRLMPVEDRVGDAGPNDNIRVLEVNKIGGAGLDIGIRLWDVSSRRQPPPPVRPELIDVPQEELEADERKDG